MQALGDQLLAEQAERRVLQYVTEAGTINHHTVRALEVALDRQLIRTAVVRAAPAVEGWEMHHLPPRQSRRGVQGQKGKDDQAHGLYEVQPPGVRETYL